MILRAALAAVALALPAAAQEAGLREAADRLVRASGQLEAAQRKVARIAALTETVAAHEAALDALRDGLRRAELAGDALRGGLAAREARIARLLGALSGAARPGAPAPATHPQGALGAARAAILLGQTTKTLRTRAAVLRTELDALARLDALQRDAADRIGSGLTAVQAARLALSRSVTARTEAPVAPAEATPNALRDRARALTAFADALAALPDLPRATPLKRPLPPPVPAPILRAPGEADAAGIVRPGAILAPAPGAILTAPASGTVRHAGPLLDYDLVILLEPAPDVMLVFAGASELYVEPGDVVAAGAPLAAMRSSDAEAGASDPETLYVEAREAGRPANPLDWFAFE